MEHLLLDSILMVPQDHPTQTVRFIQLAAARGMHCRGTSGHLNKTGQGGLFTGSGLCCRILLRDQGSGHQLSIDDVKGWGSVAAGYLLDLCAGGKKSEAGLWMSLGEATVDSEEGVSHCAATMWPWRCHCRNIVLCWPCSCLIGNTIDIPLGNIIVQLLVGLTFTFSLIITIMSQSINPTIQGRLIK